jgi:hypothetical protein
MENTLEAHLSRIQDHLAIGRNVLRSLRTNDLRAYDVPDVIPDRTVTQFRPPEDTDVYALHPHILTDGPLSTMQVLHLHR